MPKKSHTFLTFSMHWCFCMLFGQSATLYDLWPSLIQATISSCLYCYASPTASTLTPLHSFSVLQSILSFEHIAYVISFLWKGTLHWLLITCKIKFRFLTVVSKALNKLTPASHSDHNSYHSVSLLSSSSTVLVCVEHAK